MDIPNGGPGAGSFLEVQGAATAERAAQMLEELLQLGIDIGSDGELSSVLDRIVRQARRFTGAEAATLFLREGSYLRFSVVQNEMTVRRLGERDMQNRLELERLPLDVPSLAGHVANSGEILNVPEAYDIPRDVPYAFNWRVDLATGYRTHSVLAVPLRDASRRIQGVLQLINPAGPDARGVPFHPRLQSGGPAVAPYPAIARRRRPLRGPSLQGPPP